MYCANCESLIDEKLNYCNRCGNRVAGNELAKQTNPNVSVLENLSSSVGYVGFFGLGGFIGLIAILIGNNVLSELVAVISILYLLTTFGICFLLTRQISRLTGNLISLKENSKHQAAPEQLNAPVTGQIESPRQPFAGVTENTTRTLDEVLAKRS